jgi:hypothetical protein
MVLPLEHLHYAVAGGLGRLALSSAILICAEARGAITKIEAAIRANFFIFIDTFLQNGYRDSTWHLALSGTKGFR